MKLSGEEEKPPKVSIAVVTYNHGMFIGACLDSVLRQETTFPFDIVVGDDGSTDSTGEIVARYADAFPDRIQPILHPHNLGVHANWQSVLRACRGEYIAQLDGDDLMRPGKLERQAEYLDLHPESALCFHNMRVFDSLSGRTLHYFNPPGPQQVHTLDDLVRFGTVYAQSSKMFRRSAFPEEGLDPATRYILDWLFQLQNARHGQIGYIEEVLGEYRKHGGGTTALPVDRYRDLLQDQLHTLARAKEFGASDEALREGEARVWFLAAVRYLDGGSTDEFRDAIERSAITGKWVSPSQLMCYRLRRMPGLLQYAAALFRRLSIEPRLRAAASAIEARGSQPGARYD